MARRGVDTTHSADVERGVQASRLLAGLPPADLAAVVQAGHGVRGTRGRLVLHAGDDAVAIVLRGTALERRPSPDGGEVVSDLHGPGDTCGLTAALGHPDVGADLLALDAVDVLIVPGRTLRALVAERPALAQAALRVLAAEHAASQREAAMFAASSTAQRVETRLIELAERWGSAERGQITITAPLTQEELASWARSSRESTAKTLHDLRRAGLVVTGRRELTILDLEALRDRTRRAPTDPTVRALLHAIG